MRVLVTGGAGFIGSHLCERLLEAGDEVVCMDNLVTGTLSNISHFTDEPGFEFIEHDVSKYITVDGDVDYVLHFACPASPIDFPKIPIQIMKVDSLGTHNALGLAKAKGAKFMQASTSEVYGDPLVHPQSESYWGNVNPIGPRSVYDEAKRFSEALVMAYHKIHSLDTRIVRIFNTYGPRMRVDDGRVVPTFIKQALTGEPVTLFGDGTQTRSFCYIDDEVEGILRLMKARHPLPVNVGNPGEFTMIELAEMILDITGSASELTNLPMPQDDPKRRRPDIGLAKRLLGWEPKIELKQGLEKTIDYMRDKI